MKQKMRQFFFGTSLNDNKVVNTGWLLFRLHIGLSMAIHAGFPKMKNMAAPGWFNEQVAGLGFTFPSPAFWATLASWGEFVGGICIALGLLTRFNALQLAFQFFVISFLWYDNPEPLTGMYFQNTLFMGFVLATFFGGGRYSLDKLIMTRKTVNTPIVTKAALAMILLCVSLNSTAQRKPLKGSGIVVNKTFDYKDFDKIILTDLSGKVEVQVGKPFSISVDIDDNLSSLLSVSAGNGKLEMELTGNENNRMYIENTNINIKISLPEISVLEHRGNDNVTVNGITGRNFRMQKSGNGDVILKGSIDEFEITKSGNGDINAANLVAKSVTVNSSGNGDVVVNASNYFNATGSGNGDIKNTGAALANAASSKSGNGDIIDAGYKEKANPYPGTENDTKVKTRIKNNTNEWVELKVVYPVKGSYGIDVKPGATRKEYFPLGTKIDREGKMKEPLFEITPANRDSVLVIEK
jgi:uncharacterized membrane protein YphA (DoxX/SURF4 family)